MAVVLRWCEWSAFGLEFELLCHVADMGEARELARQAELRFLPQKSDRLGRTDPLGAVAAKHPGQLLWRVVDADSQWSVGAAELAAIRDADVQRFHQIRDEARRRRRKRR
jgi:hypothetical protein